MTMNEVRAVVTGASRGLGAALARELARAGAQVLLVARNGEELSRVVSSLREEGHQAHGFAADVSDKQRVHAIAAAAAALVGPVDLLVNNASTLGPVPLQLLLDTPCEEVERALAVNLLAPFRLIKAMAGGMALRERGLIVNVTSDAALNAYPRWGAYGLSKAALEHLTRTLAEELKGTGVRLLSIDPGEMDTRMHEEALPEADRSALRRPEQVARGILSLLTADPRGAGERLEVSV